MRRIRGADTKLELKLRRALWAAGVRGWRCNVRGVLGTPDIAWPSRKLAVFVDSAWWHGHESRWVPGRLGPRWDKKIEGNKRRDVEVTERLVRDGWRVIRVWDFELEGDLPVVVARIQRAVRETTRAHER
jgi:DNA mismatch endonuclease, patch repair protein